MRAGISMTQAYGSAKCITGSSQTCDIAGSLDTEPAIEALICVPDPPGNFGRISNSSRYFMVDADNKLVAFASKRVLIPKETLRGVAPGSRLQDDGHRQLFAEWLANRWNRIAFPNAFVHAFQGPLGKALDKEKRKNTPIWQVLDSTVFHFRAAWKEDMSDSPLEASVLALVRDPSPPDSLLIVRRVVEPYIEKANATPKTPILFKERLMIATPATLALADAWEYRPIDFDHLSDEGDELSWLSPSVD